MLDSFIREMSARWGLADQGRPLVQMLVAYINNPATGGLTGFLDKFRKAGWGGMVNSWVGNQGTAEVPTTSQIETVLGSGEGFLNQVANRLGLSADKVSAAVAGMLPALIGRMTPDGTIPMSLPAEFDGLAREGQSLLGWGAGAATAAYGAARTGAHTAATAVAEPTSSGGLGKWLPWLIAALVVIFGVSYCSKDKTPVEQPVVETTPAPAADPMPQPPEPAPAVTEPAVTDPAPAVTDPAAPALAPSAPVESSSAPHAAPDSSTDTANFTVPNGADVVDGMVNGLPVLRVFFDVGKTDVAPAFADKSKALVDFLQANSEVTAVISGFNDPTGDPVRNAELAKERAQAVKAALEAAGIAADRAILEKPADTTDTGSTNAESRRVDVMLRR